ncbi:uncharacterized protein LOC113367065 [Ctenocephalides felis]|uniref:uncharacterized protein LOC113367065 n=1 Tax=Ctenocephalides felis TaxID=7515 RepID=UPI000E6E14E4|nr:uncharacterized protein LOC113367065 [Ctenocephalides felis]
MKLWPVLLLVAVGWVHCMTVDNASTKALRSAITSDELEITIRDLKPRKTGRTLPEVLLAVDFPHAAYRFTILLDWTSQTVVLETTRLGQSESKQAFALPNLDTESFVSSLILHVRQERPDARIEVYENCELRGTFHTNTTFRDAFESEDDHKRVVKVRLLEQCIITRTNAMIYMLKILEYMN